MADTVGLGPRVFRPRPLPSGEGAVLAIALAIVLTLSGLPLVLLLRLAVMGEAGFSLGPLIEALSSRSVVSALVNSLKSGLLSAAFATALGTVFAFLVGLTDLRGKTPLVFLLLLPLMIPPHVTAIAWTQALGPASPILSALGMAPPPGTPNPLYSPGGLVALLSLQHAPLAFLVVRAALRSLPSEISDAARVAGAGRMRVLRRIILPLIVPSLIAAFALAFVSALGNFGINALIGIPARYTTLPVLIWRRLASFGTGMLDDVAVIAALLVGVALIAVAIQAIAARGRRFGLIGPPQTPLALSLGPARPFVEAALWGFTTIVVLLPLGSLLATALVPVYGVPLGFETVTLKNFAEVLFRQAVTIRAFVNSSMLAGGAALCLAVLAILLGYSMNAAGTVRRSAARGGAAFAEIAYAVPGLVLSVGLILAFLRPLPVFGVSLYNTPWIILVAYMAAFFAIALKPVNAAYGQLDANLDAAARLAGAGFGRRLAAIFVPLTMPAAASGALLVFLTAYNEVTVSALLWSTGNETIGTTIFNYEDGGYSTLAAAMAFVTVILTVLLMALLDWASRYLPRGVVPWK